MTVLHHVRFVNYSPAAVTAVAFPPLAPAAPYAAPSSSAGSSSRPAPGTCGLMAVGKGNGQVELFKWVETAEGGQGWVFYRVRLSLERARKGEDERV
jgi:U3 small nucleolar RNA-associated protein 4